VNPNVENVVEVWYGLGELYVTDVYRDGRIIEYLLLKKQKKSSVKLIKITLSK